MKVPAIGVLSALLCAAAAVPARAAVPEAPDQVRKEKITDNDVLITWRDNSFDEQGFEILRRVVTDPVDAWESRGTVGVDVQEFLDTAPKGTLFIYRVRAFNADCPSSLSNECYVTRTPPPKPLSFFVRLIALYTVDVTWSDRSAGERGFEIQRALVGRSFKTIARVPANTEYYRDQTDRPATDYVYRMRATGRSGICQDDSAFTPLRAVTTLGAKRILSVELRGRGKGTVTSVPAGISCGPKDDHCTAEFPITSNVVLVAKPTPKSRFAGWADYQKCEGQAGPCSVYMGDNKTIAAPFRVRM